MGCFPSSAKVYVLDPKTATPTSKHFRPPINGWIAAPPEAGAAFLPLPHEDAPAAAGPLARRRRRSSADSHSSHHSQQSHSSQHSLVSHGSHYSRVSGSGSHGAFAGNGSGTGHSRQHGGAGGHGGSGSVVSGGGSRRSSRSTASGVAGSGKGSGHLARKAMHGAARSRTASVDDHSDTNLSGSGFAPHRRGSGGPGVGSSFGLTAEGARRDSAPGSVMALPDELAAVSRGSARRDSSHSHYSHASRASQRSVASTVYDRETGRMLMYSETRMQVNPATGAYKPFQVADFRKLKLLAVGGAGEVFIAQHKHDKKYYALKRMVRAQIVKRKQRKHLLSEVTLQGTLHSPFLVHLFDVIQDSKAVYLVMEYVPGGELFGQMLDRTYQVRPMAEQVARFYFVELACALQFLHTNAGVLYRDLKPENILIDDRGHVKLADFGFARRLEHGEEFNGRSRRVGTAQYMAPELMSAKDPESRAGYGYPVDWWALGCLLYEMLAGDSPFGDVGAGQSKDAVRRAIVSGQFAMPAQAVSDKGLRKLLRGLLTVDPARRWSYEQVVESEWLFDIDWALAGSRRLKPPFVPDLMKTASTQHFMPLADKKPINSWKVSGREADESDIVSCIVHE